MLNLKNISKSFGPKSVFADFSHEFNSGITVISGLNGAGKSTLLRMVAGVINPDAGKIIYQNQDITKYQPEERRFGYLSQKVHLFPLATVEENIYYSYKNRQGNLEAAQEIIKTLELSDKLHMPPWALSGGYQSRVALARVLVSEPRVLLLDEPLSELDVVIKQSLLTSWSTLLRSAKIPVLYVTHDNSEAHEVADFKLDLFHI